MFPGPVVTKGRFPLATEELAPARAAPAPASEVGGPGRTRQGPAAGTRGQVLPADLSAPPSEDRGLLSWCSPPALPESFQNSGPG